MELFIKAVIGGIIIAGRLGSGSSNAGVMFELEVIAAVVLGGTNLFGGRGTIIGTLLGALTIAMIGNGLILLHVSRHVHLQELFCSSYNHLENTQSSHHKVYQ